MPKYYHSMPWMKHKQGIAKEASVDMSINFSSKNGFMSSISWTALRSALLR